MQLRTHSRDWTQEIRALTDLLLAANEGETVTYDAMTLRLNEPVDAKSYALRKAREDLTKRAVHFECIPEVGYRRMTPSEVATSGARRSRLKVFRAARRGLARLFLGDDVSKLNQGERTTHWGHTAALQAVKTATHGNHVNKVIRDAPQESAADKELRRIREAVKGGEKV